MSEAGIFFHEVANFSSNGDSPPNSARVFHVTFITIHRMDKTDSSAAEDSTRAESMKAAPSSLSSSIKEVATGGSGATTKAEAAQPSSSSINEDPEAVILVGPDDPEGVPGTCLIVLIHVVLILGQSGLTRIKLIFNSITTYWSTMQLRWIWPKRMTTSSEKSEQPRIKA